MSGNQDRSGERLRLTRRRLLGSMSSLALTTALAGGCTGRVGEGRPWSDETFFADGTGWVEETSA